jgi:hypothetical protein
MTFSEALGVGILVAVIGWALKSLIGLYLRRKALKGALLIDIQSRISVWNSNKAFLDRLVDADIKPADKVPYTAFYQPSKESLFTALLSELMSHLPYQFPHISKIYGAFNEVEELLIGFFRDITKWKENSHVLSEADIRYLRAKRDRISSYVAIFNKAEIRKLSDLPKDYRGIHGTEVVTGTITSD